MTPTDPLKGDWNDDEASGLHWRIDGSRAWLVESETGRATEFREEEEVRIVRDQVVREGWFRCDGRGKRLQPTPADPTPAPVAINLQELLITLRALDLLGELSIDGQVIRWYYSTTGGDQDWIATVSRDEREAMAPHLPPGWGFWGIDQDNDSAWFVVKEEPAPAKDAAPADPSLEAMAAAREIYAGHGTLPEEAWKEPGHRDKVIRSYAEEIDKAFAARIAKLVEDWSVAASRVESLTNQLRWRDPALELPDDGDDVDVCFEGQSRVKVAVYTFDDNEEPQWSGHGWHSSDRGHPPVILWRPRPVVPPTSKG